MTAPLSPERLAEIRAREQAATPGEWYVALFGLDHRFAVLRRELDKRWDLPVTEILRREDAAFIAHARSDIPALLDEVERLTAAHQRAWELLSECRTAFFAALHDAPGLDGERGEVLLRAIDAVREVVAEGCP